MRTVSAAAGMLLIAASMAHADVLIVIDKSTQQVRVVADGELAHVFKSSTGKHGAGTPNGTYGVERMHRRWYSRKYDYAPMPYSIFYDGAYAIHGTTVISRLGRPASHGCVRLHPDDAKVLFALVREQGKENTAVIVTGANPKANPSQAIAQKRKRRPSRQARRTRHFGLGPFGWWGRL